MKRSKIRRHSRKLSKRHGSCKVSRRSVRLSKKQRRSLRKMSKRIRSRLTFLDKAKSGLSKMGSSIQSGMNKVSSSISKPINYLKMTPLEKNIYEQKQNELKQAELTKEIAELNVQKEIDKVENDYKEMIGNIETHLEVREKALQKLNKEVENGKSQLKAKTDLTEKLKNQTKALDEEIQNLSAKIEQHNEEIKTLLPAIEHLKKELDKAKKAQEEKEKIRKGQA